MPIAPPDVIRPAMSPRIDLYIAPNRGFYKELSDEYGLNRVNKLLILSLKQIIRQPFPLVGDLFAGGDGAGQAFDPYHFQAFGRNYYFVPDPYAFSADPAFWAEPPDHRDRHDHQVQAVWLSMWRPLVHAKADLRPGLRSGGSSFRYRAGNRVLHGHRTKWLYRWHRRGLCGQCDT